MKDFFRIFSAKMRVIGGNPEKPNWLIEKPFLLTSENPQIIYSLLFAYQAEHKNNAWYKNKFILEAAEYVVTELLKNKDSYRMRRLSSVLMETYPLLCIHLPHLKTKYEVLVKNSAIHFAEKLVDRQYLTQLSSANIGYGTNHLSIELKAIVQYFKYCEKALGGLPNINEVFLKNYLKRFMDYMNPEGYWPETDGPASCYNRLTGSCILSVAIELNEVEKYRRHFEKVSEFHAYTTFPDGRLMDLFDGRNSNASLDHLGTFLPFTPAGNYWYEKMIPLFEKNLPFNYAFGQALHFLLVDEIVKEKFGVKESVSAWKNKNVEKKINDFMVVKNENWIAGVSNFKFRPRPEGHFTIDHQNLLSLYHTEFGEIFGGQNSKNDPEIAFFSKFMTTFDGDPVSKPMPKYIPGNGKIKYQDNSLSVERDYRGFEGCFSVIFKDAYHLEISLSARARAEEYPIQCNLILPCGTERPFFDANQNQIILDETPKQLTKKDTGDFICFNEYMAPQVLEKGKNKKLKISVPKEATIQWPFKPWDTYNTVSDRELLPKKWYCVMHINLTHEPVLLNIEIM